MFLPTRNCWVLSLFRHVKFFGNYLLITVLFPVLLSCDHSNSQLIIATYLSTLPDVGLTPTCWRAPSDRIICHLLTTLSCFNLLCHSKTHACNTIISMYLLKYFKFFSWSFLQLDHKFQVYLFFSAHIWMTWKRRCKQKHVKKDAMYAESWDHSYIFPRYHVR